MSASYGELIAALESLPANPRIVASGNGAIPFELLHIVDNTLPAFTLNMLAAHAGLPLREGVTHETSFVGAGMRKSPHLSYVPARLSMVPLLFSRTLPPDAVIAHTSLPHNGKISLGIETNVVVGAIEACKARGGKIIAQANKQMPYTFGDSEYDVADFDIIYEVDLPVANYQGRKTVSADSSDTEIIGALAADRIKDGSTLQLGIGAIPDAVLPELVHKKRLGIWTEMFSDGVLSLLDAGAMDMDRPIVLLGGQRGALRVDAPQRAGRHAPHRDDQQPGQHRAAAADDIGQHRASGRPLRPGQRISHQGTHPLRLRRADRLHRRCPALARWAGDHGAAFLAPQGRRLDDRAPHRRASDLLPAQRDHHRAGRGRDLRS